MRIGSRGSMKYITYSEATIEPGNWMTKEFWLRFTSLDLARKFAALRSRGEPSVPAQLALDGLDCQLRRR
jgi:hypothetical protein